MFFTLAASIYVAAGLDMTETMKVRQTNASFVETDPLARPFTRLPAPAYYAVGFTMVTGLNLLSLHMMHSRCWRRVSWVPQLLAAGGNTFGYVYSRRSQ